MILVAQVLDALPSVCSDGGLPWCDGRVVDITRLGDQGPWGRCTKCGLLFEVHVTDPEAALAVGKKA
jgi:hypothetical protein